MSKSSNEVVNRYRNKTFKRYDVMFRNGDDEEIISFIEERRSSGKSTSEVFKEIIKSAMKELEDTHE